MDLNARVDVNCGRKGGRTDEKPEVYIAITSENRRRNCSKISRGFPITNIGHEERIVGTQSLILKSNPKAWSSDYKNLVVISVNMMARKYEKK